MSTEPKKLFGLQLLTTDVAKVIPFYSALFGWTAQQKEGFYTMACPADTSLPSLIMQHPIWGMPSAWFVYFEVKSLFKALTAVPELGGKVIQPAMPSPLGGLYAVVADPSGAVLGLYEPLLPQPGVKDIKHTDPGPSGPH